MDGDSALPDEHHPEAISRRPDSGAAAASGRPSRIGAPAVFADRAEHALILAFFGGRPGVFVDVGANYPESSISTPLEKQGWTGVVVEPQPDCVAALQTARTCAIVHAACVSDAAAAKGGVELHLAGRQSSTSRNFIAPRERTDEHILVPAKTLTSILDEASLTAIDVLSLDTEGTEIEVMNGLDWTRFAPTLILLEDHARDFSKHRYMRSRGYTLFRRTGFNSWYAKPERALPVSPFGRLQLVRKYVLSMPIRRFRRWRHETFG